MAKPADARSRTSSRATSRASNLNVIGPECPFLAPESSKGWRKLHSPSGLAAAATAARGRGSATCIAIDCLTVVSLVHAIRAHQPRARVESILLSSSLAASSGMNHSIRNFVAAFSLYLRPQSRATSRVRRSAPRRNRRRGVLVCVADVELDAQRPAHRVGAVDCQDHTAAAPRVHDTHALGEDAPLHRLLLVETIGGAVIEDDDVGLVPQVVVPHIGDYALKTAQT